jgi:hypothetical protein
MRKLMQTVCTKSLGSFVAVFWQSETREYIARLYPSGKLHSPADCFETDHDAAMKTALAMFDKMQAAEPRMYGVSSGNGNDGVSQLFADYYVATDKPWKLATLAAIVKFKHGAGMQWALRHVDIDGDAESTIYACFDAPPCEETPDGEYPDVENPEDAEDGRNWSDGNGAWLIIEVFPVQGYREGRPHYESLEAAFSADLLALVPDDE